MPMTADFWGLLDEAEPRLASWPIGELVQLIDDVKGAEPEDPVAVVERAMGRSLGVEEKGLVMVKALAPVNLGIPPRPLRVTFTRVAGMAEPWAAAVSAGAVGTQD